MAILRNWISLTLANIDLLVLYIQNDFRILYIETKICVSVFLCFFVYIIKLCLKMFDKILIYFFKIITQML